MRKLLIAAGAAALAGCANSETIEGVVFVPDDAPPNPWLGDVCEPRGEESYGWDDWTCTDVTGSRPVFGHRVRGDGRLSDGDEDGGSARIAGLTGGA